MPVYTELLSDDQIISIVPDNYHNLLIIGCGACTNESIAFKCGYPIFKLEEEEEIYPYATVMELKRIQNLLEKNGYNVSIKYYNDIDGFFCMKNINNDNYTLEWKNVPDAILCMCCPGGISALKKTVGSIPLLGITKLMGTLSYVYEDREGTRVIIKEKSKAVVFGE